MVRKSIKLWATLCLFSFAGTLAANQPAKPDITKMGVKLRKLLKSEATSRETKTHPDAVVELCDFCAAMRSDSRYATSSVLRGFAAQGRRRLIEVRRFLLLQLKKNKIEKPANFNENLAQLERLLAQQASQSESQPSSTTVQTRTPEPPNVAARGPGPDNGWMLVELINRTIRPDFWAPQGGPGVVQYYSLQRALVVRATTQAHEDIAALLRALGGLPR